MIRKLVLAVVLYLPSLIASAAMQDKIKIPDSTSIIIVDKAHFLLTLVDTDGYVEEQYGIACSKNYGNKLTVGDFRTPEGLYYINQIQDSRSMCHDFGDGNGPIPHAYGPWFFRLEVPDFYGVGIHGTHLPESIGSRCTEGCIRLRNEDIIDLKKYVHIGMPVLILPDSCRNYTVTEPLDKVYDFAFFSQNSRVDSLMEFEKKVGKKVVRISDNLSDIQASIHTIKASECVIFDDDTTESKLALKQLLLSYVIQDTTVKCLFYPTDSLYFSRSDISRINDTPGSVWMLIVAILIIALIPGLSFLAKKLLEKVHR